MMTKQQTSLKLQLSTCHQRSVLPEDYPPPQGYEWIPGYLQQYGGQLTPWGRDWLNAKAQEPWVAAVDAAEQEYQDCLDAHASHEPPAAATGLRIQFKTQLKGARSAPSLQGKGPQARLRLSFSPATPPPAPSAPKPVFWISTTAAFDEEALYQAMYSPWGLFSQDRPLSRKGIALDADATIAALSYEHQFAPAPAGVLLQDDVREALEVAANRLAFVAQLPDGSLAGTWQAVHAPGVSFDFSGIYDSGGGFNWDGIAVNCFADVTVRVQASPTLSLSVLNGEGDAIADLTVTLSHTGTIASWPVAAVHRLFHNATQETEIASPPPIDAGPAAIGQSMEVAFSLPEGLAGQVEPDLSISYFDQAGLVSVLAVPAASPGQIGLRLTRLSPFYRMEGRMHLYFKLIPSAHDVRRWPAYASPIRCAVPIVWQQCNAAGEDRPWDAGRDSGVRIILDAWEASSLTHYGPATFDNTWEHEVWLRLRDYAAPCDAFDDPANAHYEADVRATWPDGQTSALHRTSYSSNFDDSMRFVWQTQARNGDPPAFSVAIEFHYFGLNLCRKADDSGYENRPIPGSPARRIQTFTPTP